jgi:hypothetical protein
VKNYGDAKLDDYHQAQAVDVMNYWIYFKSPGSEQLSRPVDW